MEAAVMESPSLQPPEVRPQAKTVSLRRLKGLAARMGPSHPLRVVLLSEPDEVPWEEYAAKSEIWFRLLTLKGD
jgi:hypothetical protein